MKERRRLCAATVGLVAGACLFAWAAWSPPARLDFLDERTMRLLMRAEGPFPGGNGQFPMERAFAVDQSPRELSRWLGPQLERRGLSRQSGIGATGRWASDDGQTVVEVLLVPPSNLAAPDPPAKAYVFAVEPQPNPPVNRAYHWVKRKWYRDRGIVEPESLPRDLIR